MGGRPAQTAVFVALRAALPRHSDMKNTSARGRALRLWLAGQATVVVGAAAMAWTHSFIPMALAGSAALMMTVPLVKAIARGKRARR